MLALAIVVVAAAIWATCAAVMENLRFAQGTDQVLQLIAKARDLAARDKNLATQPGEDVIAELAHAGLLNGVNDGVPKTISNPWQGPIRATSPKASLMRIETDLPARDCRHMALFFIKNDSDLGLSMMEARSRGMQAWQHFFDPAHGVNVSGSTMVEDACTQVEPVTLAMVVSLR